MLTPILIGIGVSPGIVEGKAKIITGNADNFGENEILITRITDPTMVIHMSKAAAIVCDIGSMTSHPSIVAREMGIPCVVNTKRATTMLKNGMNIRVDGTKGEIYLLD